MLPIALIVGAMGRGATVNLDGEAISSVTIDPNTSHAKVAFNLDGTIDSLRLAGPTTTQIDAATDWIIPNSQANDTYEVRFVTTPTDAFTVQAAVKDTWIALSTTRTWGYQKTGTGTLQSGNITFEIRRGSSGGAIATGVYSMTATVDPGG